MLNLQQRLDLLKQLKQYILSDDIQWAFAKRTASQQNAWFTEEFIDDAVQNIVNCFLNEEKLAQWISHYKLPEQNTSPVNVGITMAGNIPLVGFHDFLCTFITGNQQTIKLSAKDSVLLKYLTDKLVEWNGTAAAFIQYKEILKGCDAYIATGSNNSARYFEYYFKKYPNIIRRNRTSVAIITGKETYEELLALSDDVYMYFGLGCRNVTKIYVPQHYDFIPLLEAFKKYDRVIENHKYKHNYDYHLAMHIINQKFYMTNGSIVLVEDNPVFSPISELHYQFYSNKDEIYQSLNPEEIQCIAGNEKTPFGSTQQPQLNDYADGIDTMHFLLSIQNKSAVEN
ncbi:MAG: acyl-CoA reductase [Agriterribacter sp.]